MAAKKKKIKTITLNNGETLEVFDASKKVAGDSWFVNVLFRVQIDVTKAHFSEADLEKYEFNEIQSALGDCIIFEVARERKFILDSKKNQLIEHFIDDYLKNTYSYIAKPEFPKKFILKKYSEFLRERLPHA